MANIIIFGCLGGLLPDILRIIKSRYMSQVPEYLRHPIFWIGVVFLVALGGLAAWLGGAQNLKEAIAYGFSAPEIISKLASKSAEEVGRGEVPFRLRHWWTS